jgi:hypothetical protein
VYDSFYTKQGVLFLWQEIGRALEWLYSASATDVGVRYPTERGCVEIVELKLRSVKGKKVYNTGTNRPSNSEEVYSGKSVARRL